MIISNRYYFCLGQENVQKKGLEEEEAEEADLEIEKSIEEREDATIARERVISPEIAAKSEKTAENAAEKEEETHSEAG
jgi:hypothetical protein